MMQREPDESGLFSLATFQTLRLEALDLFDRSLSERKPEYFEHFVQRQVVQQPPPLELLSQLAEDVHQRLLKLRQRHFDARDDVRRALLHQYGFDVTPFLPADPVEYHRLDLDETLAFFSRQQPYLNEDSHRSVQVLLQDALASAVEQYAEMALTESLYTYVMDWLMALHLVSVRGAWADDLRAIEPLFMQ
jgi:hypothetical protein